MTLSQTALALQKAAAGLTYQSETDAPWTAFSWADQSGPPTLDKVRQAAKHKPSAPAVEQSVDEFFQPLVTLQDWFGDAEKTTANQYRSLLALVQSSLQQPKVFRIGTRKIAVYLIGTAPEGGWAGLKTSAVET